MDWITGMQRAIDYVENHLTENIDYELVAKESFSSSYHFQRMFSILCGYTLGEYMNGAQTIWIRSLARKRQSVLNKLSFLPDFI